MKCAGFLLAAALCVLLSGPARGDGPASLQQLQECGLKARARWLPYEAWDSEYRNYFERHYHDPSLQFTPTAIVMHYTAGHTLDEAWNTFARGATYDDGDVGRVKGHLSSHFLIDRDGTVNYILPTDRRCRGAYGVNHVAISIEMVAMDERAVLADPPLVASALRLVECLCKHYAIPSSRVWGHYQVAAGRSVVPDYTDYGDRRHPDRYPARDMRTDPGKKFMQKLWADLKAKGL